MKNFLQGNTLTKFLAIQAFLVPRALTLTNTQKDEAIKIINDYIATKPIAIAYKIKLFLTIIDLFSIFFGLSTFKNLSAKKKKMVMDFFFDSPIALFRKGFWGINTLSKMGVYTLTSIHSDLGYKLKEI